MRLIFFNLLLVISLSATGQNRTGLELSLLGTYSNIVVPGALSSRFDEAKSGLGNDIAFGVEVPFSYNKLAFRTGLRSWSFPFDHQHTQRRSSGPDVVISEEGNIRYTGIYLRLDRTWERFFVTGGFDISVANTYRNDYTMSEKSGKVIRREENRKESVLTDNFRNQINLVLGAGPTFPLGEKSRLKATLAIVVPFSSMYDSGVRLKQIYVPSGSPAPDGEPNLHFFPVFKFGLSYTFWT
jgi:hypothetical protein